MDSKQREPAGKPRENTPPRRNQFWPVLLIVLLGFLMLRSIWPALSVEEVPYSVFLKQLDSENVQSLEINGTTALGTFKVPPDRPASYDAKGELVTSEAGKEPGKLEKKFMVQLSEGSIERIEASVKEQNERNAASNKEPLSLSYSNSNPFEYLMLFFLIGLPIVLVIAVWMMFLSLIHI